MHKIGLIAEGITDFTVLKFLIGAFLKDPNISFRELQPDNNPSPDPASGEPTGNWDKVLKYLASERFIKAFEYAEFVLIQIDSDVCHEFNVSKKDENYNELPPEQLIERIKARLIQQMGQEFYELNRQKILFAISVESIECWLLPFVADKPAHFGKTVNCLGTLNDYLGKSLKFSIDLKNKRNEYYLKIMRQKELFKCDQNKSKYFQNPSLKAFFEQEILKLNS